MSIVLPPRKPKRLVSQDLYDLEDERSIDNFFTSLLDEIKPLPTAELNAFHTNFKKNLKGGGQKIEISSITVRTRPPAGHQQDVLSLVGWFSLTLLSASCMYAVGLHLDEEGHEDLQAM